MKKLILGVLILLTICSIRCKNEANPGQDQVEVIKTDEHDPASIIRNPISAKGSKDTVNVAKMEFKSPKYDFGTANQGDVVRHTFKFTNTGKVPLVITNAKSTCGCTVPKWPKDPILPGKSGKIDVKFNTSGRSGRQSKPVKITANTYPMTTVIHISGEVSKKEE